MIRDRNSLGLIGASIAIAALAAAARDPGEPVVVVVRDDPQPPRRPAPTMQPTVIARCDAERIERAKMKRARRAQLRQARS